MSVSWGVRYFAVNHSDPFKCKVVIADCYPKHDAKNDQEVEAKLPKEYRIRNGYTVTEFMHKEDAIRDMRSKLFPLLCSEIQDLSCRIANCEKEIAMQRMGVNDGVRCFSDFAKSCIKEYKEKIKELRKLYKAKVEVETK